MSRMQEAHPRVQSLHKMAEEERDVKGGREMKKMIEGDLEIDEFNDGFGGEVRFVVLLVPVPGEENAVWDTLAENASEFDGKKVRIIIETLEGEK